MINLIAWKENFLFSLIYSSKLLESSYIVIVFQSNISDLHITQICKQSNSVDAEQNHSWKSSSTVCTKISMLLTLNDMSVAEHYCYFIQVIITESVVGGHASGTRISSILVITHGRASPFLA